jgi:hypothetical protein
MTLQVDSAVDSDRMERTETPDEAAQRHLDAQSVELTPAGGARAVHLKKLARFT